MKYSPGNTWLRLTPEKTFWTGPSLCEASSFSIGPPREDIGQGPLELRHWWWWSKTSRWLMETHWGCGADGEVVDCIKSSHWSDMVMWEFRHERTDFPYRALAKASFLRINHCNSMFERSDAMNIDAGTDTFRTASNRFHWPGHEILSCARVLFYHSWLKQHRARFLYRNSPLWIISLLHKKIVYVKIFHFSPEFPFVSSCGTETSITDHRMKSTWF